MFSLREKLTAIFTVNGFCDEAKVNNAISKALSWCKANPCQPVKDWCNQWYGNAL